MTILDETRGIVLDESDTQLPPFRGTGLPDAVPEPQDWVDRMDADMGQLHDEWATEDRDEPGDLSAYQFFALVTENFPRVRVVATMREEVFCNLSDLRGPVERSVFAHVQWPESADPQPFPRQDQQPIRSYKALYEAIEAESQRRAVQQARMPAGVA